MMIHNMAERPTGAPDGPETDALTPRQQRVLTALLAAPTAKEAAAMAGVGERTLKRWKTFPAFQRAYRAAQSEMLEDAVNQSRQHLTGALSTLAGVAGDENAPAAARVSAARASVELSLKLSEQNDILRRLDELEKMMNGSDADVKF